MKMYDKQLYANVEDLLVQSGTRRHYDWLLECFATNVQGIDLFTQRACEIGEVNCYL